MRVIPRIDLENATGFADKVVGLGKELVGQVFDEPRLVEAGTAQQGKGTEKLAALRKRTEAESHRRTARRREDAQRDAQAAKAG